MSYIKKVEKGSSAEVEYRTPWLLLRLNSLVLHIFFVILKFIFRILLF